MTHAMVFTGLLPPHFLFQQTIFGSRAANSISIFPVCSLCCGSGFDAVEGEERPRKWRVENSWGDTGSDKGYFVMTDDWFDEFLYQVCL